MCYMPSTQHATKLVHHQWWKQSINCDQYNPAFWPSFYACKDHWTTCNKPVSTIAPYNQNTQPTPTRKYQQHSPSLTTSAAIKCKTTLCVYMYQPVQRFRLSTCIGINLCPSTFAVSNGSHLVRAQYRVCSPAAYAYDMLFVCKSAPTTQQLCTPEGLGQRRYPDLYPHGRCLVHAWYLCAAVIRPYTGYPMNKTCWWW